MTEFEKGEKILLLGGGGVANAFHVVRFLGWKEGDENPKQAVLETNGRLPNPFEPYIRLRDLPLGGVGWRLAKLSPQLADLELGHYLQCGDSIIDYDSIPLFGSIYQGRVVKTLEENGGGQNGVVEGEV